MIFVKMAWRDLWRNRRRTVITVVVMGFCCVFMLTMTSLILGFHKGIVENSIKVGDGHIQIHKKGFHAMWTAEYYLEQSAPLLQTIESEKGIEHYALRVKGLGLVSHTSQAKNIKIVGIQPQREKNISLFHRKRTPGSQGTLIAGEYLRTDDWKEGHIDGDPRKRYRLPGVLIGYDTADKLKVEVDSKIVVTVQGLKGELKQNLCRVRGIFRTLVPSYDKSTVFVHYKTAQKLFGYLDSGYFSEVVIVADSYAEMSPLAAKLQRQISSQQYELLTWDDLHKSALEFMRVQKVFLSIVIAILMAIVSIGIIITVLISIFERVREFGVMRALGMADSRLISVVLLGTLWLALLSFAAGSAIAIPLCLHLQSQGLDLSGAITEASIAPISLDTTVYADLRYTTVILGFVILVSVSLLVSLYPAWRATRIQVVEALTFV